MKFKEWRYWIKHLPFHKKWYAIFILFRPVIDAFWEAKDTSPFISPPYIVGVLTVLFAAFFILHDKKKNQITVWSFNLFAFFLLYNTVLLYIQNPAIQTFGTFLKYTTPLVLFYYIKKFFLDENDLNGILYTFLLSSIIPFIILFYEVIIGPISPEFLGESRGGGARLRGLYADSFNYAIYFVGAFLIVIYFYLKKHKAKTKRELRNFIFLIGICAIGLISIKHTATWTVILSLIILFVFIQLQAGKGLWFIIILFGLFLPVFGQYIYESQINPLISKEFRVIEGEEPVERSFNGRASRWLQYYEWWGKMDPISQYFGVQHSGGSEASVMVSGKTHNDFIRIFFLTGVPGFIAYISFLFSVLFAGLKASREKLFLFVGTFLIVFLYSVSALPTLYPTLLYFIIPIFIHAVKFNKPKILYYEKAKNINLREAASPVYGPGNSYRNNS